MWQLYDQSFCFRLLLVCHIVEVNELGVLELRAES
jgi:hypothetical protein